MRKGRAAWAIGVAGALLLGLGCGGGDTAIVGLGNSGNRLVADPLAGLADTLADFEATPEVTDRMIRLVFEAIRERAESGDPEAAMVVLRLAAAQREVDSK